MFRLFLRLACVLPVAFSAIRAERLPIKIYTSADGFGSSAGFGLVRDARGFIWFCSRDGLVRFDGYRFITYRLGGSDTDPAVYSLLPTRAGAYWINLNRGTDYRFFPPNDAAPVAPVEKIAVKNDYRIPLNAEPLPAEALPAFEDNDGYLWTYDEKNLIRTREPYGQAARELTELNLPGNPTGKLTNATFIGGRENDFWVGTNWGLVRRLPNGKIVHYTTNTESGDNWVRFFAVDAQSRIWIARPDGLFVLKAEDASQFDAAENFTARRPVVRKGAVNSNGQAQMPEQAGEAVVFSFNDFLLAESKKELSDKNAEKPAIFSIICASDGKMWIGSNHGLVTYDGKRFQQHTTREGLGANVIASLAEDNDGYIWAASYGGLHRINPHGLIQYDETDGIKRERVHSIYETRDGELEIVSGNFNVGALRTDGKLITAHPRLPKDEVVMWQSNAALLDSRGDWWVNTNKHLYRFTVASRVEDLDDKPPTDTFNSQNGLLADATLRVFEDSGGDIWATTNPEQNGSGLVRWRHESGEFEQFTAKDGLPQPASGVSFAEDAAGNRWFGFSEGGIARFRDGRFTTLTERDGLQTGGITGIFRDHLNRMWISSSIGGLSRVDNPLDEHPTFKRYTMSEGLTSNNVRCIAEDFFGNIYIGTVRGINRISPDTGRVKFYGTSDGLASDFVNVAYRDRSGAMWFGTHNGLSKLVPEPDKPLPPPSILISGLKVAGEDYSVSPLGQKTVLVPDQSANRNNVQIDFLSITTGGDAAMRYQYRLEGATDDWSEPTADRSLTFANLSPAAYRFEVRAVNADEVVSPQPAVVTFTVLRPVWQRWWFLILASLAVGSAIYALYRYRIAQIIKLERVRTRIATDLHDDIGASLSKIAILSEVVHQRVAPIAAEDNQINEPLDVIAGTSREMVDSMSDIVWAINPTKDHLSDLIGRMRNLAGEMTELCDIGLRVHLSGIENRDLHLGTDLRREVYLIFKETLNNLVKHSKCERVEIEFKLEHDWLIIKVADDGCGFDVPAKANGNGNAATRGGNGLINMRRRAENLGGSYEIESIVGRGTTSVLRVPLKMKTRGFGLSKLLSK